MYPPASTGLFAANSHCAAIRPAILDAAGEAPIMTKAYADAFQETDLADHLTGTADLLIVGMMTQNCVVFTALSGLAKGFHMQVVGDLCTAPAKVVHGIG